MSNVYAQGGGGGGLIPPTTPVGGVFEPVNEAVLYGELAKQYSIWLIPVIGIGVGIYSKFLTYSKTYDGNNNSCHPKYY